MKIHFCLSHSLVVSALIFLSGCRTTETPYIDYTKLNELDNQWAIVSKDSLGEKGCIRLANQKWLMFFLHWKPLTEEKKDISVDYARNTMLTLWGPDMPFTLEDGGSETLVCGHKAYIANGTLNNGMVKTRFIIWNCPETQRQFISDCNINLKMGTPEKLHQLQFEDITQSINCHNSNSVIKNENLSQTINNEKYNIQFSIPENWRADEFVYDTNQMDYPIPGFYPNGMSSKEGSYLAVLKDSEKKIELRWLNDNTPNPISGLDTFLDLVISDTTRDMLDTFKINFVSKNFQFEQIDTSQEYLSGVGEYEYVMKLDNYDYSQTEKYRCKVLLWENNNNTFFVLASMIAYTDMLGVPFDLTPDNEMLDEFVKKEVLPVIQVINFRM